MSTTKKTSRKRGEGEGAGGERGIGNGKRDSAKSSTGIARPPQRPRDVDWTPIYLEFLSQKGAYLASAEAAGISYTLVWNRRQDDPAFARAEQKSLAIAQASWEDEVRRRAVDGCPEHHYDAKGNLIRTKINYSDTLLLRMLERRDPTWRQKQEITVEKGPAATREERMQALLGARSADAKPLS